MGGYLTSSYVMNIYVYRPKLGDFYKLFMCWVVGLDCFTATGLYILPRFPLLIYIQILVSAIHTINDNVNNRSFIQSIKQLLRPIGQSGTSDLWISFLYLYSPPLYQLSYRRFILCYVITIYIFHF